MNIIELEQREDIYAILEESLAVYIQDVYKETVSVKVENSILRNSFVVYPRLDAIISRFPSWRVAKDIYLSYNIQDSILKKILAWGYITLCLLTFGLMAKKSLSISNYNLLNRNTFIMPCNRKIRVFYYDKGYVDAILKTGFVDNCFKNEIKYRTNPQFDFIPAVQKFGARWYREGILKGELLVRIPEPDYSRIVADVVNCLDLLYKSSLEKINIYTYCYKLYSRIITSLPFLKTAKNINTTDYIKRVADHALKVVQNSSVDIPIAVSHGDMQTGNIKIDRKTGKIIIYDWETAAIRSVWYDMGRLLLYSQRKDRFAYMVENCEMADVKQYLLKLDQCKDYNMREVIAVLILEELNAFIEEIKDLPSTTGPEVMERLTCELQKTQEYAHI